jgi:hypothetical protein
MFPDVIFDQFPGQTCHRTPNGSHEVQDLAAWRIRFETPLHGLDLPPKTSDACEKLVFVFRCVANNIGG